MTRKTAVGAVAGPRSREFVCSVRTYPLRKPFNEVFNQDPEMTWISFIRDPFDWPDNCQRKNYYAQNAFFGARAGHPWLKAAIHRVIENVKNRHYGEFIVSPTGPYLLARHP